MLVIGILIAANSAEAIPQGTVIKEGILTYPAGPYLAEDPLLLSLGSYGDDNRTQASGDSSKTACPEKKRPCPGKECAYFDNSYNRNPGNLGAENLWICPFNLFSIYYGPNIEIMYPGFVLLCCPAFPLFQPDSFALSILSNPLSATFC